MRTLSVLFWLSSSMVYGSAYAADCETPYSTDQLLTDLIEAEELLKTEDKGAILSKSKGMESGLSCMTETLPPILIGRVYRAIAGGLFYAGEEARGKAWFLTAVEVDPSYIYGIEDIGANHPIRMAYDEIRMQPQSDPVAVSGQMLREGPRHLLDGKRLREAAARADRPHLYQLDEDGIRSWVIEGNALPEDALTGAAVADAGEQKAEKPAKAKKAPKEKPEKVAKAPKEKPEKVAKAPKEKPETAAKAPKEKPEKVAKAPKEKPEKVAKAPAKEPKQGAEKSPKETVAKVPKEKPEKAPKEQTVKPPKEKVAKAPKEPVVKEPKPAKVKPTKTKVAPVGLTTTVIGRDRPPEQIPLIVTGALAIVGSGVLYGLAVSNQNAFDDLASWKVSGSNPINDAPTDRQTLLRKQQAANRLFLGTFAVAAAGVSTLTYGIIIDGRTGRVMPTFNVRF